jgi:quinol monooxygenase YgiN
VIIILGTIQLPPENLAAAREAMRMMVEASRAESGCLDYAYAEDVLQPGLIRVMERWRDQDCLDAHVLAPHLKAWRAAWPDLAISERRLFAYEAGEPRPI